MHTPAAERDIHAENWARYTDKKISWILTSREKKKKIRRETEKKSWLKETFLSPPPPPLAPAWRAKWSPF